jgi:acetyl-CoA decarbonylase/synthase complex subunit gamma
MIIIHSISGWSLLPLVILRENIYTDPRKPVSVEPGINSFGEPDEMSPLFLTTNFALTYYTVASDIESAKLNCYLVVVDTDGLSVESAVAGRHLTADSVAESLDSFKAGELVKHRHLIIPGRAARLSGEIQEVSGWTISVGPMDSSGVGKYIDEKWGKTIPEME